MAFGRIDTELLGDLALAGLLHDIGITQVSHRVVQKNWKEFNQNELIAFSKHVNHSVDIIKAAAPNLSERVTHLISQHHEQFNGEGYPNRLEGFHFDDLSQIVSMADLLDSISTGEWDGKKRSLGDSLMILENLELEAHFPIFYNPDIFNLVVKWVRTAIEDPSINQASKKVQKQVEKVAKS